MWPLFVEVSEQTEIHCNKLILFTHEAKWRLINMMNHRQQLLQNPNY